jgi:hypothetical protein
VDNINKDLMSPYLIYSSPYQYGNITLYPICMDKIIEFLTLKESIILRKDSHFKEKAIIKMTYYEFLIYCATNKEVGIKYKIPNLHMYFWFALELLKMICKDQSFEVLNDNLYINGEEITSEKFDDLRRIAILQNDIDFDIDEFIHYDTEQALIKAQSKINKDASNVNIEDYIDSLCIALGYSEEQVMKLSIRKFWRYIKRYNLHEYYTICKTGEQSGMVKYKEPIKHWIISLDDADKYKDLKANEGEIRGKVG